MSAALRDVVQPVELASLRGGEVVAMRPMRASDAGALRRMWHRLSERTVYQRFMTTYPKGLPDSTLRYLVSVDHHDREALVAVFWDRIVGVARYHTVAPGEAEIAVLVEDAWQRRGLGRALTQRLADLARNRGIVVLSGTMLADNDAAYGLMRALFPQVESRIVNGEREFRIVLAPPSARSA